MKAVLVLPFLLGTLPPPHAAAAAQATAVDPSTTASRDDGLMILNRSCTSCHESSQVTQARPRADWQPILERMRANGANISDAEAQVLLSYLTTHYSSDR